MGNGFGITSFILSLMGVFVLFFSGFGMIVPIIALIIGFLGLIFSILQLRKGKTGLAIAGLVISILVILVGGFNIFAQIFVNKTVDSLMDQKLGELGQVQRGLSN